MFDCILLMAGKGERSKLNYNKIKYLVNGKPLYQYSIDEFKKSNNLNIIYLVVREDEYNDYKMLESDKIKIVVGGKERQDSVYNALCASTSDIVLIHDAARPNIKVTEIDEVYDNTVKYSSCALAVKETNAIKRVKDSLVIGEIDRNEVYAMQTPQGAKRELLKSALEHINHMVYDDTQALEEYYNIRTFIVNGRYENIKVTNETDLKYIELLLGEIDV